MAVRYRDTVTKRFVSKATWTRSKAHGGTRYKRERIEEDEKPRRKKKPPEPPKAPPEPPEEPEGPEEEEPEYTGAFDTP